MPATGEFHFMEHAGEGLVLFPEKLRKELDFSV
jgi:hypothetical protein